VALTIVACALSLALLALRAQQRSWRPFALLGLFTAAVIMTMEPVFAAVIATTPGGESIGATGWIGGVLVVSAMFLSELGPRHCCDALAPRIECC
jgi:drug/metabolite transporter (DMT)-like permease